MEFVWLSRWQCQLLGTLRIVAALLFMEHGLVKLFDFPVPQPGPPDPLPAILIAAAIIEIIGGGLVALGLLTRLAAFAVSGEMAIGYFVGHFPMSFWPVANEGDAAILFCFVFLYIAAAGAGAWSVDGKLAKAAPGQRSR